MSEIRNVYDRKIKLQFEDKAVQQYGKTLSDYQKHTENQDAGVSVFSEATNMPGLLLVTR